MKRGFWIILLAFTLLLLAQLACDSGLDGSYVPPHDEQKEACIRKGYLWYSGNCLYDRNPYGTRIP